MTAPVSSAPPSLRYVLITPARNEVAYIEGTIKSVIAQSIKPTRWVIVSDGSTDGTDEIVLRYAAEHPWIELLRMPERKERQFAAKAHAFNAGYAKLRGLDYDLVGNLDADLTFKPDYFEFLLGKLIANPRLGVIGTPFVEDFDRPDHHTYAHGTANLEHVSGACQLFRRECFEAIGGYVPVKGGAIDWIAVTTARMRGWQTRTFTERVLFHHRKIGTGNNSAWMVNYHYGKKAYYTGSHPLWALTRGLFQMRKSPYIVAGGLFQLGYLWAAITRMQRPVSTELMTFHRGEQMRRFSSILKRQPPVTSQHVDC